MQESKRVRVPERERNYVCEKEGILGIDLSTCRRKRGVCERDSENKYLLWTRKLVPETKFEFAKKRASTNVIKCECVRMQERERVQMPEREFEVPILPNQIKMLWQGYVTVICQTYLQLTKNLSFCCVIRRLLGFTYIT